MDDTEAKWVEAEQRVLDLLGEAAEAELAWQRWRRMVRALDPAADPMAGLQPSTAVTAAILALATQVWDVAEMLLATQKELAAVTQAIRELPRPE